MIFRVLANIRILLLIFVTTLCNFDIKLAASDKVRLWSYDEYPDIKDKRWEGCGTHTPKLGYVCDPDHIITEDEAIRLNNKLYEISIKTKCKCRRRSQCISKTGPYNQKIVVGFVVVVAFLHDITWTHSVDRPSEDMAAKFSKGLRDRWVLGDCGNSVLIFVWAQELLIHIVADEKSQEYITKREARRMAQKTQRKLNSRDDLVDALMQLMPEMQREFDGEPKKPVDIGQLALIISSTVALISVAIVIGCVCAFRFEIFRSKAAVDDELQVEIIRDRINEDKFIDTEIVLNATVSPKKSRVDFWSNDVKV